MTITPSGGICESLADRDPAVATAAALLHVDTSERWLRAHLADLENLDGG